MGFIPAYLGFPNVQVLENDLSQRIGLVSNQEFGAIGEFTDGPIDEITSVSSQDELARIFGTTTTTNFDYWWNIARVFQYRDNGIGGIGRITRVVNTGTLNGALGVTSTSIVNDTDTTAQLIKNETDRTGVTITFDTHSTANSGDDTVTKVKFFNRYPTTRVIQIAVSNSTDFNSAEIRNGVTFSNDFTANRITAPTGTQIAVAVLENNNVIERYVVDLVDGNVDTQNQSTYINDVINERSTRIIAYDNSSQSGGIVSFEATDFKKGAVVAPIKTNFTSALNLYNDFKIVDIKYMLAHQLIVKETLTFAENRSDVYVFFGVDLSDVVGIDANTAVTNIIDYARTTINQSSTYGGFIGNAGFILDSYRQKRVYIGLAGDALGQRIRQDLSNPALASSGLIRGRILNLIKLAFNPNSTQQRDLGNANIVSIINYPGVGPVTFEVLNFTPVDSLLRQNTSRVTLIDIVKASRRNLVFNLFDNNTPVLRANIKAKMDAFLDRLVANGSVTAYRTIADETNNADDSEVMVLAIIINLPRIIKQISIITNIVGTTGDVETTIL